MQMSDELLPGERYDARRGPPHHHHHLGRITRGDRGDRAVVRWAVGWSSGWGVSPGTLEKATLIVGQHHSTSDHPTVDVGHPTTSSAELLLVFLLASLAANLR